MSEWTAREGEWESFKGRLDATRGPLARSSGRTGSPLAAGRRSTRCGEAPGAAVDSPGRVDRRQYLCRRHFLCRPFLATPFGVQRVIQTSQTTTAGGACG